MCVLRLLLLCLLFVCSFKADSGSVVVEFYNHQKLPQWFPCHSLSWLTNSVVCDLMVPAGRIYVYRWLNKRKKNMYQVRTHELVSRKRDLSENLATNPKHASSKGAGVSSKRASHSNLATNPKHASSKGAGDPLFSRQWYLNNIKMAGHDINVLPVWKNGIKGKGVVISLIDDGVDYNHADLKESFREDLSYDFNSGKLLPVPNPALRDHHGTRCAGQLVSKPDNGICGVGICPEAQISAIRILSKAVSSVNEAAAVVYKYHENHIYSCSWGPADDGKAIDAPDPLVLRSFVDGILKGRDGKGSIYVFAAGNGKSVDNCNYDGYANGIFALTVGAVDVNHKMPVYMEPCSAQLVTAYSSNEDFKIPTTDLGNDQCTLKHGGTSAAAPMVTGILALALSVRPDLSWRDLRYLCVQTAIPFSTNDPSWVKNGSGRLYSHKFGFGKIDATKFVESAKKWKRVERMTLRSLPTIPCNLVISKSESAVKSIQIDEYVIEKMHLKDLENLEYVTITLNIKHSSRGDIMILLQSPAGTISPLATRRPLDTSSKGLKEWTMMTAAFWGESVAGTWILTVKNSPRTNGYGSLENFRITFWGSLSPDVVETDETFSANFLNNYYPPSKDYFEDRSSVWNAKRQPVEVVESTISMNYVLLIGGMILALAFIVVFRKYRLSKREFAPVPDRFNSPEETMCSLGDE